MKSTFAVVSLDIVAAAAAPDPLVTPRATLARRQESDAALLGWVDAANGQFSDQRSCDFPATLSSSGSLAQCCASSTCTFWQSCSVGTLFAQQTSLFCDQGFCNTAVIVPTVGASSGQSYLGCWATSLGDQAFTIVRDIGAAPTAAASDASSSASARSSASRSGASGTTTSAKSSAAGSGSSAGSGSATQSSTGATQSTQSTAAAAAVADKPLMSVFGMFAVVLGML